MIKHKIVEDTAGWGGWPRITCDSCRKQVVRAPHESRDQWAKRSEQFRAEHMAGREN